MVSANEKMDLAKDKMSENLMLAMENQANLAVLDEKALNLKLVAEDFDHDAEELAEFMAARNRRMGVTIAALGVGGGFSIVAPLFQFM